MQTTLNRGAQQASRPRRLEQWRLWAVFVGFVLFGLYNGQKLFSLQVLQHAELADKAETRIKWKDILPPTRGLIYDTNGQLLAGNTTATDIYVDKSNLFVDTKAGRVLSDAKLHEVTDLLAPALGQDAGDLFTRLKETSSTSLRVATRVDDTVVAKVRDVIRKNSTALAYKVQFEVQPKRQYPGDALASSVLGFTDNDNQGHYGVEEYYNAQLAGKAGWILAEHDAEGRPLVLSQPEMEPAVDGSDLVLTINSAVQYLAERELKRSIDEFKAESGYVLVQDPNTGGILAMANFPSFNPNDFSKVTNYELFKNATVNNIVEPGSTMKILTYASSIDAGAVLSTTSFYGKACVQHYGWNLCNATHTEYGIQTMTQGLGRSDNIASMYAAEQLGEAGFYKYIQAFGIGKRTGIDMAGEVGGTLWLPGQDGYSPINLYTNSFGQGVSTTPIQLITAVSAVANGGSLYKPFIRKEIRNGDTVVEQADPKPLRQVVKPETARDIADMLSFGVENKMVARFSMVPGYHVSVKTGTAQIPCDGGYCTNGSLASAMGFAPSHGARFTLYIGLKNPQTSQWGENTASVSWGRLAKELLMYMKVQPTGPIPTATPTP